MFRVSKFGFRNLLDWYSLIPLVIAGIITVLVGLVFYFHDGFAFKLQAGASLGIFTDWWKHVAGGYWEVWWQKTAWWVSWPVLLLGLVGFALVVVRGYRGYKEGRGGGRGEGLILFTFYFLLSAFLITTRKPFNPRYFLPVVPFLCVYAALGLGWICLLFERVLASRELPGLLDSALRWAQDSVRRGIVLVPLLLIPSTDTAFQASRHTLIEDVGGYLRVARSEERLEKSPWLFSNWWPTYFREPTGIANTTWLAESVKETAEFAAVNNRSALTILNQEGGVVVLESLYSKDLYTPQVRKVAQDLLERNANPTVAIEDPQPNFPFYRSGENQIKVYSIESGIRFK